MKLQDKFKIAISGIGGVGGYIGGLLAKKFKDSQEVEIYFISRGENLQAIRHHGLKLMTALREFIVYPKLTTSDPSLIGPVDLLICCTKSYDLEENIRHCSPCIDPDTILLPLLNGVDSRETIAKQYPSNPICDGCIYIVTQLIEPGVVKQSGSICKVYFACNNNTDDRLKKISDLFTSAGINATLAEDIQHEVWEKFIFISAMATLTSYLDCSIGTILADPAKAELVHSLLSEIKMVAENKKISFPFDIVQHSLERMKKVPKETSSSMHLDFQRRKRTEIESLTGYIVRAGKEFSLAVPTYEMMYTFLKNKSQ